jgi:hypothetical protein
MSTILIGIMSNKNCRRTALAAHVAHIRNTDSKGGDYLRHVSAYGRIIVKWI